MPRKPTISDVARLSGLSTATVDRVLNGRAGVSQTAREKIEKAIEELRYATTALAAQNPAKEKNIDVFLSEGRNPFFAELWKGFRAALDSMPMSESAVRLIGFDPYREDSLLQALRARRPDLDAAIVVGVDTAAIRDEVDTMVDQGIRVVTTVSDILGTRRSAYVGLDNFAAGRTTGKLMSQMVCGETGTFAVLIGNLQFRHLMDRYAGFRQIVKSLKPEIKVVLLQPYGANISKTYKAVSGLAQEYSDLAGVYLLGAGNAGVYQGLREFQERGVVTIAHELTDESRRALDRGDLDVVVAQDTIRIANDTLQCALGRLNTPGFGEIRIIISENMPSTAAYSRT